jgi:D-alanyl-D-alanine carboxypeptidase (penicillin-binding protein 5/6)
MNREAARLKLKNTNFTNPHGLSDKANHSSAFELARLCSHCMKNCAFFAELVNTKVHHAVTYIELSRASKLMQIEPEKLEQYV